MADYSPTAISLGTAPAATDGDTTRAAFQKVMNDLAVIWNAMTIDSSSYNVGVGRSPITGVSLTVANTFTIIRDGGIPGLTMTSYGSAPNFITNKSNGSEATPSAVLNNDTLFAMQMRGYDGAGFDFDGNYYVLAATEDWDATGHGFKQIWYTTAAGAVTMTARMTLDDDGGLFMNGATGSSQGSGTINAVGVYDDSSLLTCYVLDALIDGDIDLDAWNARVPNRELAEEFADVETVDHRGKPMTARIKVKDAETIERTHAPAAAFKADAANRLDPKAFFDNFKARRALPAMPTRDEWAADGPLSTGDLIQRLWETVETQTVHINALLERIETLENA